MVEPVNPLSEHVLVKDSLDLSSSLAKTNQLEGLSIDSSLMPKLANDGFVAYDHVTFYVSNAKLSSRFFINSLGFYPIAYKGLETGSKNICHHVVSNGSVTFQFVSTLRSFSDNKNEDLMIKEIQNHVAKHGDGVKDVAFQVENVSHVFELAVANGARPILKPTVLKEEGSTLVIAKVGALGDVVHTLINRSQYKGVFMPEYISYEDAFGHDYMRTVSELNEKVLPKVSFACIDHCVQNQDWNEMFQSCEFYAKAFGFHQFWSVDENVICTQYSALRSTVMASSNELVKMPINEPAKGLKKSQIEEFLDFYEGPGVQHIALLTPNIVSTVKNMKFRGVEFINVPPKYYSRLRQRLLETKRNYEIKESLDELEKAGILVDFDENGYLLQLFSKPMQDRPTLFLEVIQRENHNGFGAGNFKALFETLELEQQRRGNLV
ncbi:hypothetical protein LJB42_000950 [Komagataella kurtzmanii]|nr:hypothetical protein LJB42_000950 [Komagataella kurtzmanii]